MDATALSTLRSRFPHINEGLVYLNHAATSPLSTAVLQAMERHLERRSVGPIDTYEEDIVAINGLRSSIQRLVNAPSVDRIAFVQNTSDAINLMASGLSWSAGDRILLNDMEFPANVYPYLNLKRLGVEIDTIACAAGELTPEAVERALTPRTRVVALSAVQFLSGYRADLRSIGALCKAKGVLLLVDGIQAVGAVQIDVQKMNIDGMACGGQKWLMSPHGTGFIYVSEQLQSRLHQQYLGWLSMNVPWDFRNYGQPMAPSARRYEGGTMNFPGLMGMKGAISLMEETGWKAIEERVATLVDELIERLDKIDGVTLVSPRKWSERAGIVTVRLTSAESAKHVFGRLMSSRMVISLREGHLRISPHYYNSNEELDAIAEGLANALRESMISRTKS